MPAQRASNAWLIHYESASRYLGLCLLVSASADILVNAYLEISLRIFSWDERVPQLATWQTSPIVCVSMRCFTICLPSALNQSGLGCPRLCFDEVQLLGFDISNMDNVMASCETAVSDLARAIVTA